MKIIDDIKCPTCGSHDIIVCHESRVVEFHPIQGISYDEQLTQLYVVVKDPPDNMEYLESLAQSLECEKGHTFVLGNGCVVEYV